jgi:hypothetical protein
VIADLEIELRPGDEAAATGAPTRVKSFVPGGESTIPRQRPVGAGIGRIPNMRMAQQPCQTEISNKIDERRFRSENQLIKRRIGLAKIAYANRGITPSS